MENLLDKLVHYRQKRKLSQSAVANAIGMSPGNYAKIERGEIRPYLNTVYDIAYALKVNVMDLLTPTNDKGMILDDPEAIYQANQKMKVLIQLNLSKKELAELELERFAVEVI